MLIIFTKKWQEDGISSAWMNVGLIVILFAVGWTFTGMISKVVMEQKGFGIYFDRDTFEIIPVKVHPTANKITINPTFIHAEEIPSSCHFFVKMISINMKCTKNIIAVIILLKYYN
jgi:hypothetical protein